MTTIDQIGLETPEYKQIYPYVDAVPIASGTVFDLFVRVNSTPSSSVHVVVSKNSVQLTDETAQTDANGMLEFWTANDTMGNQDITYNFVVDGQSVSVVIKTTSTVIIDPDPEPDNSQGKIYIGMSDGNVDSAYIDNFKSITGKGVALIGFFNWLSHPDDAVTRIANAKVTCAAGKAIGCLMAWDLGNMERAGDNTDTQPITDMANGALDSTIRKIAKAFKDFPYKKYVVFGVEMNGSWNGWGYDPTVFKNAWRRTKQIFQEEGANVKFVFQPNSAPEQNLDWYFGDMGLIQDYYDPSLVDIFSVSCHAAAWIYAPVNFKDAMTKYLALDPSKPFMFSEFGASPHWENTSVPSASERAKWLSEAFDWMVLHKDRFMAFMYYQYDSYSSIGEEQALTDVYISKVANNPVFTDKAIGDTPVIPFSITPLLAGLAAFAGLIVIYAATR
jgi:hypothetical protein